MRVHKIPGSLFRPLPEQTPKMLTLRVKVDGASMRLERAIANLFDRQASASDSEPANAALLAIADHDP